MVSKSAASRNRDLDTKRVDYAEAAIAEYWLVDPAAKSISVLNLPEDGVEYVESLFGHGDIARPSLLPGFTIDVDAIFATLSSVSDAAPEA